MLIFILNWSSLLTTITTKYQTDLSLPHNAAVKMRAAGIKSDGVGMWVGSPEHRLSLELWIQEGRTTENNNKIDLSPAQTSNEVLILDESDTICNHKYHIVYATGSPQPLTEWFLRAEIIQCVTLTLCENPSKKIKKLLADPNFAVTKPSIRIIDSSSKKAEELYSCLVDSLLSNPPDTLAWVLNDVYKNRHRELKSFVLSPNKLSPQKELYLFQDSNERHKMTMLRGLVTHGVLHHCLTLRHSVQYGMSKKRSKRVAVPYIAAGIPHERSEFCHPDVQILLTQLAMYQRGLEFKELIESLKGLLELPQGRKDGVYRAWLESVRPQYENDDKFNTIDSIGKLDLSNEVQSQYCFEVFAYCKETINFFLLNMVYPHDTISYPSRLTCSPWDLVAHRPTIGFSGTNDTAQLLPLYIEQREPAIDSVRATNGLMIDRIIKHASTIIHMNGNTNIWEDCITIAVNEKMDAIIDTGCLLAEAGDLKNCALKIADLITTHQSYKKGVMYFANDGWVVMNLRENNRIFSKLESSLNDSDCFVIFDEARCIGSDMKLNINARAAQTLGKGLLKDKFMQGAGRLRQLGSEQKISILVPREVSLKLPKKQMTTDIKDILQWVVENTCTSITGGLSEWFMSGLHHHKVKHNQNEAVQYDDWSLTTMYSGSQKSELISKFALNAVSLITEPTEDVTLIKEKCIELGEGVSLKISTADAECEKEIAREEEQEKEVSVELLEEVAKKEKRWDYSLILNTTSVLSTWRWISLTEMNSLEILGKLKWCSPQNKIYATHNWFDTTADNSKENAIATGYLQYNTDSGSEFLLLSDREANGILSCILKHEATPFLKKLSFKFGFLYTSPAPSPEVFTWLKVWNGECLYPKEYYQYICDIFNNIHARHCIPSLVSIRGMTHHYIGSALDRAAQNYLANASDVRARN